MTTVQDICDILEEFAPLSLQEEYDNSGLQIGDRKAEVKSVLLCIDITEEVVDEAREKGCNMIISHHPLLFHSIRSITGSNYIENCITKAIQHNIAIYSAHTNMDNAKGGVSWRMAEKLGLTDVKVLSPKEDGENGCGVIGTLPESKSTLSFIELLKDAFYTPIVRCYTGRSSEIHRIALCGGSGAEFIPAALNANVDAYVTADLKYHDFFIQPSNLLLVDIGHFESEQYTKEIFFDLISKKLSNFAIQKSEVKTNQINYI